MLAWIIRGILFVATPIAALLVSRDALNFGIVEMLVAILLIAGFVLAAAAWTLLRKPGTADTSGK